MWGPRDPAGQNAVLCLEHPQDSGKPSSQRQVRPSSCPLQKSLWRRLGVEFEGKPEMMGVVGLREYIKLVVVRVALRGI